MPHTSRGLNHALARGLLIWVGVLDAILSVYWALFMTLTLGAAPPRRWGLHGPRLAEQLEGPLVFGVLVGGLAILLIARAEGRPLWIRRCTVTITLLYTALFVAVRVMTVLRT